MLDTNMGQRLANYTLPEIIRKLDAVSKLDVDGLIRAINRMAAAQEDANRIAKREMFFEKSNTETKQTGDDKEVAIFVERVLYEVSQSSDGLLIRDAPGAPKWASTIRESQRIRDILIAKGVNIEEDEDDGTFILTMKEEG